MNRNDLLLVVNLSVSYVVQGSGRSLTIMKSIIMIIITTVGLELPPLPVVEVPTSLRWRRVDDIDVSVSNEAGFGGTFARTVIIGRVNPIIEFSRVRVRAAFQFRTIAASGALIWAESKRAN